MNTEGEKPEEPLNLIKQYLGGLRHEKVRSTNRDVALLPSEMRMNFAILLAAEGLRQDKGIEPAKNWIRNQFPLEDLAEGGGEKGTFQSINRKDADAILKAAYDLLNEERNNRTL